jgi:hypothetical protein
MGVHRHGPPIPIHLRQQTAPGRSKDWIAEVDGDRLIIHHGRTGGTLRRHVIPAGDCTDCSPETEARMRAEAKRRGGYVTLGVPVDDPPPVAENETGTLPSDWPKRWF